MRKKDGEDKTMSETAGSRALTWVARIWSLASIVFVLVFVFGELLSGHGAMPTTTEWFVLALWPGGVALGLVVAWFRKGLGGVIAIGSLTAFYVWNLLERGRLPRGPYFLLVAAPGVLFLLSSFLSRPRQQMRPG
jgi:hypothetical protein